MLSLLNKLRSHQIDHLPFHEGTKKKLPFYHWFYNRNNVYFPFMAVKVDRQKSQLHIKSVWQQTFESVGNRTPSLKRRRLEALRRKPFFFLGGIKFNVDLFADIRIALARSQRRLVLQRRR